MKAEFERTAEQPVMVAIGGPTASGKTQVGVALAHALNGEVISTDSRQFYKHLSIGTAKPTPEEMEGVGHHFIDFLEVDRAMSAGEFSRRATEVVMDVVRRGRLPIAVGGSGLYMRALTEGIDDLPADAALRRELMDLHRVQGLDALRQRLQSKDAEALSSIDGDNPVRVMRAIELVELTGEPLRAVRARRPQRPPFRSIKIGLRRDRKELYEAINTRVDRMLDRGLEAEVRSLAHHRDRQALRTVGYREWFPYFDGAYDREEAIRLIKRNTRRYAKRQMTWYGKEKDLSWFDPRDFDAILNHVKTELGA